MARNVCRGYFRCVLFLTLIFGAVIPLCMVILLQFNQQATMRDDLLLRSHRILYVDLDLKRRQVEEMENHLKELESIKIRALNDLLKIDEKRTKVNSDIYEMSTQKSELEKAVKYLKNDVEKSKKEVGNLQQFLQQKIVSKTIYIGKPLGNDLIEDTSRLEYKMNQGKNLTNVNCNFNQCFDFTRCSILNFFIQVDLPNDKTLMSHYNLLHLNFPMSKNENSCLTISVINIDVTNKELERHANFINNNGKNNLIVIRSNRKIEETCAKIQLLQNYKNILITENYCKPFRVDYDFLIPHLALPSTTNNSELWKLMPDLLPIHRKYFIYYSKAITDRTKQIGAALKQLTDFNNNNDVYIKTYCENNSFNTNCFWCQCELDKERYSFLRNSTFALIFTDDPRFFTDVIEAFFHGAIPVVIGNYRLMPYGDIIDWKLACVFVSYQRLPELLLKLKTLVIDNVVSLKTQGRFLFETYFSNELKILQTVISALKNRIDLPPSPTKDFETVLYFNNTKNSQKIVSPNRMFSVIGYDQYRVWNKFPGGIKVYPSVPWINPTPTRLQFNGAIKDHFMPIGDGRGGDGVAFARSLGGDYPVELFTVLMLTYDREVILMEALNRLSGLKYLHKVVIVWNNPKPPSPDLEWPDIGASIEVISAGHNSLNNRFIPYKNIETEAILSMDDDIYLRHDEIELAFRVWRENRDRLVGFPGRHHAFDSSTDSFYYSSEHSCELSLVLTGGAFFHKYYSYVYTYDLNPSIKQKVDEYMNCEDIAMNFLMAHITQKPPVKVTSRWTFRCPGCPVALSADDNHYEERNLCMQYFEKVFGYNPLKRTQYRADSILFKTRLPSAKTKCFQYV